MVTITADGAGGADDTGTSCSVTGTGGTGTKVVTTLPPATAATTFTIVVGGTGGTGAPIPGQTITFTGRGGNLPLCTVVTNANGTASCTATFDKGYAGNILAFDNLVIFGYTATYTPTPATPDPPPTPVSHSAQSDQAHCDTRRDGHDGIRGARPAGTAHDHRFITKRLGAEHDSRLGISGLPDGARSAVYGIGGLYQLIVMIRASLGLSMTASSW